MAAHGSVGRVVTAGTQRRRPTTACTGRPQRVFHQPCVLRCRLCVIVGRRVMPGVRHLIFVLDGVSMKKIKIQIVLLLALVIILLAFASPIIAQRLPRLMSLMTIRPSLKARGKCR